MKTGFIKMKCSNHQREQFLEKKQNYQRATTLKKLQAHMYGFTGVLQNLQRLDLSNAI